MLELIVWQSAEPTPEIPAIGRGRPSENVEADTPIQKCKRKGIRRQGIVWTTKEFLSKELLPCRHSMCPYLSSPDPS